MSEAAGPILSTRGRSAAPSVVTELAATTAWDPFLSLRALAAYTSLGERTLRGFLRDPVNPLPHYQVGGRILVRRSDFDSWIEIHREPATSADDLVAKILSGVDGTPEPPHARRGPAGRR